MNGPSGHTRIACSEVELFVYGTLMFPEVLRAVAGRTFPGQPARVHDWARFLMAGEVYPALVFQEGASTEGLVLAGVGRRALARLDRFEGEMYIRRPLTAQLVSGRSSEVQAYVLKEEHQGLLSNRPWEPEIFRRLHLDIFSVTP